WIGCLCGSRRRRARILAGDLVTMDPARPRAHAMAIVGDRIAAVGTREDAQAACPPGTRVEHLPGTVVPGLIDAHVHVLISGLERRRLDVSDAGSVAEVVSRIARYLDERPGESWVLVAAHFQAEELAERRLPTRHDLDAVTGDRPVVLDRRTHDAIANTAALRRAGIDRHAPDPPGGRIERDAAGEPTGVLVERPAAELVLDHLPPVTDAERRTALREIQPVLHGLGITGTAEPGLTAEELGSYQALWADGDLRLRTFAMPLADTDLPAEQAIERLRGSGVRTGFGDAWLRIGGVKVYLDGTGSFGSALLREPWPGTDGWRGNQTASTETFAAIARFCATERWSLAVHTVGGAAIDLALDTFAAADREASIADLRFSVMHAYLWPSARNMADARRLGVLASIQPGMQWRVASALADRLGVDGAARASPLRDWIDAGVTVAGGSDGPDFPLAPLFGMWQATTRRARGFDEPLGPEQAIGREQALAMYTTGAARYCFAEKERGALRPGLLADWTSLSEDPTVGDPERLCDARVLQTALGGTTVFEA
ncbi:MAG: amidohydrolase, partial [Solirubrobacteraceae bacterium]